MNDATSSTGLGAAEPELPSTGSADTYRDRWYKRLKDWLWGYKSPEEIQQMRQMMLDHVRQMIADQN